MSADSYHGPRRGSSNAEERWHKAAQAMAYARQRNREAGAAVFVEGRRDRQALEAYGFNGPVEVLNRCLLYTSPSPRDKRQSRMPSSA